MPFISLRDLEINIGVLQVQALALKPAEFEAAERAAAIRIVELAGVEEPETAADAPEWIRQPAAYLTFNALVPRMRSPELITWA
ncbi:MAG TPA: hypothetical protein VHI13_02815, partial [Candidatus Kapabacteria bacterium]|nr:hypothetical protein [Candidatus Kapabacteria bacterium]